MNYARMEEQLILHEGLRLRSYLDTEGYWTIGVGYNLSSRGVEDLERVCRRKFSGPLEHLTITEAEARKVLRADIERFERAIITHFPFYLELDEVRQRASLDMAFNLGFRALSFKQARAAIERRDWSRTYRELFKSKWCRQVDDGPGGHFGRADRLGQMFLTGKDWVN